ncbi:MAG: hypothetical protein FJW34_02065 [Acidobacteria bacterium]|nr:hypothetical protein [Acidobacteriota bacterium]
MSNETRPSPVTATGYVAPLARLFLREIRERFQGVLPNLPCGARLQGFETWSCGSSGLVAPIQGSVLELVRAPRFFSSILKPLAVALENTCRGLTEALVSMNCREFYATLRKTEQGPLSPEDLDRIRALPAMRPINEIRDTFRREGWPQELLDSLLPLVRARCRPAPDQAPAPMWRKGFGYALVFSGPAGGECGAMRILPVAHLGPAGVVEAHGIRLERVRREAPSSELRRKGLMYQALGRKLATEFGGSAGAERGFSTGPRTSPGVSGFTARDASGRDAVD